MITTNGASMKGIPPYLELDQIDELIDRALQEDIGSGDITSQYTIPATTRADGVFLARESGVLAGLVVAERVFQRVDPTVVVRWTSSDGEAIGAGQQFGTVSGTARAILSAERLALNFLQRMCAIATRTNEFVRAVEGSGSILLDTRKTAPGLRLLDKWAVLLGGGSNHRMGLYDMILIKDNHISAAGGVREALAAAHAGLASAAAHSGQALAAAHSGQALAAPHPGNTRANEKRFIEIEAKTLDQVQEIVDEGSANRILLDNMVTIDASGAVDTLLLERAVAMIGGQMETEASGNVSLTTVGKIAKTGVTFISCGALTHSVKALDLSLLLHT